jgi:hypothetical protein
LISPVLRADDGVQVAVSRTLLAPADLGTAHSDGSGHALEVRAVRARAGAGAPSWRLDYACTRFVGI